jgi:hypothetical protein
MPYAVSVNEKSLDLIATNNGGLKPEIEVGGTYFLLQDNPNQPATILSTEDFFETHEFIGPESPEEFRPVIRLWS